MANKLDPGHERRRHGARRACENGHHRQAGKPPYPGRAQKFLAPTSQVHSLFNACVTQNALFLLESDWQIASLVQPQPPSNSYGTVLGAVVPNTGIGKAIRVLATWGPAPATNADGDITRRQRNQHAVSAAALSAFTTTEECSRTRRQRIADPVEALPIAIACRIIGQAGAWWRRRDAASTLTCPT
jgi:hypothetical protein